MDSLRDFAPVALLNINPQLLIVNPIVPAKNVKELIALAIEVVGVKAE